MGDALAARIRYIEDITGILTSTILRDAGTKEIYLAVAPLLNLPEHKAIVQIKRGHITLMVIDFSASLTGWGTVTFSSVGSVFSRIEEYLPHIQPRRSNDASAQSRAFTTRNGDEYIWTTFRHDVQTFTFECVTARNGTFVARYYPVPLTHGNNGPAAMLEVGEEHMNSLQELVATLIILRYIAKYSTGSPFRGGRL